VEIEQIEEDLAALTCAAVAAQTTHVVAKAMRVVQIEEVGPAVDKAEYAQDA